MLKLSSSTTSSKNQLTGKETTGYSQVFITAAKVSDFKKKRKRMKISSDYLLSLQSQVTVIIVLGAMKSATYIILAVIVSFAAEKALAYRTSRYEKRNLWQGIYPGERP